MKERLQKIEKNQRKTRKKNICKNNKKQIRRNFKINTEPYLVLDFCKKKDIKMWDIEEGKTSKPY